MQKKLMGMLCLSLFFLSGCTPKNILDNMQKDYEKTEEQAYRERVLKELDVPMQKAHRDLDRPWKVDENESSSQSQ